MSTPAAKRRRIEAAASTLSKPFRSPFKSPLKSPSSLDSTRPITPATDETTSFVLSEWAPSILVSPAVTPHPTLGQHKKALSPPASIATQLTTDPDIAVLLRAQRELEKQLREVKEQLETAEQARKIERESRKTSVEGEIDGELIGLIEKWRGASRQAAEELFGKVRDRVNRMGGPKAFKEIQKRQQEFHSRWDQEEQSNIGSDEDDAEGSSPGKRDIYAEYSLDEETENEKSQRIRAVGDTTEMLGQEDEFTMAMMLRTLNVDLDIVGYDKVQQRWSD